MSSASMLASVMTVISYFIVISTKFFLAIYSKLKIRLFSSFVSGIIPFFPWFIIFVVCFLGLQEIFSYNPYLYNNHARFFVASNEQCVNNEYPEAGADPEILKKGALKVGHHGWPTKKILGFRWSKKAKINWQYISISIFKFSPFLCTIEAYR